MSSGLECWEARGFAQQLDSKPLLHCIFVFLYFLLFLYTKQKHIYVQELRRQQICEDINVGLKLLKEGGSAHGQPADQAHQLIHRNNRVYWKLKSGNYDNVYLRKAPKLSPAGILAGLSNVEFQDRQTATLEVVIFYCGLVV